MGGSYIPQDIRPEDFHERLCFDVLEMLVRPYDPCVRKHHVEPSVRLDGVCDHCLNGFLICRVELPGMDVNFGVEGFELSFVDREVLIAEVTQVNGSSAILSELMGCGPAYAEGRIRSCEWSAG